jgi:hypothetical protein
MRAWLALPALLASTFASAGPIEDDAFSAFEVLCLRSPTAELPSTMQSIGFPPLDRNQIEKAFGPAVERAWVGKRDSKAFLVFVTKTEGCGLAAPEAISGEMIAVLERQPGARLLRSDMRKVPFERDYAMFYVNHATQLEHRFLVSLVASPGVPGVELTAFSEAALKKQGRSPEWPTR